MPPLTVPHGVLYTTALLPLLRAACLTAVSPAVWDGLLAVKAPLRRHILGWGDVTTRIWNV
jgi:hypothetical protein